MCHEISPIGHASDRVPLSREIFAFKGVVPSYALPVDCTQDASMASATGRGEGTARAEALPSCKTPWRQSRGTEQLNLAKSALRRRLLEGLLHGSQVMPAFPTPQ